MNTHYTQGKSARAGFTLIELLVVIAIIGILSSVVLASLNSARQKGRDARRVSDVKQIQLALELYYDAHSSYPTALSNANLVTAPNNYISVVPSDPSATGAVCTTGAEASCYKYAALGSGATCSSYHIGGTLENTSNTVLNADADATAGTTCTGVVNNTSNADFAGTDPVYDVKP